MKAEIYVKKNKLKKAKSIFKEAIDISSKDNDTEIYMANIYYNNIYYDQAISICKTLSKLDPNNIELRLLLGKFYLGCNEFKKFKKAQSIFLECLNFEDYVDETIKYCNLLIGKYKALYDKEHWNISVIKKLKELYLALGEGKKANQVKFKLKIYLH